MDAPTNTSLLSATYHKVASHVPNIRGNARLNGITSYVSGIPFSTIDGCQRLGRRGYNGLGSLLIRLMSLINACFSRSVKNEPGKEAPPVPAQDPVLQEQIPVQPQLELKGQGIPAFLRPLYPIAAATRPSSLSSIKGVSSTIVKNTLKIGTNPFQTKAPETASAPVTTSFSFLKSSMKVVKNMNR